jgi:acetyl esterase/lipase
VWHSASKELDMSDERTRHEITTKAVLYPTPPSTAVVIRRDIEYASAAGGPLTLDVYAPGEPSRTETPVVLFVSGYSDVGARKLLGCAFKEMASYTSWATLVAASGMVAVTYSNTRPVEDLQSVVHYLAEHAGPLGIDPRQIGIWAASGNVPNALSLLISAPEQAACAVVCYGYMLDLNGSTAVADGSRAFGFVNPCAGRSCADLPSDVPMLIVRAGRDDTPGLNVSLDAFVAGALARNLPLTLVNNHTAPHAFDIMQDTETTRDVVGQILRFLQVRLGLARSGRGQLS